MRHITYKCDFCGDEIPEKELRHLGVEVYTHLSGTLRTPFFKLDGDACKTCYESIRDIVRDAVGTFTQRKSHK